MNNIGLHSAHMELEPLTDEVWGDRTILKVSMRNARSFFAAHLHPPRSAATASEAEIYEHKQGMVRIYLRNPSRGRWEEVVLSAHTPWVFIPPGWPHAGIARMPSIFFAHTCRSHTKAGEPGGNTVWLEAGENPEALQPLLRR